ncbi:hypothetical protein P7228_13025 [Altererythrobacter arenosus]|uniref:Tetratricopeptide repeat protein n=1 Tax=Altererythrobacter arenosus TaxID=3032592 RepID=A0ABY8FU27_9SPHN|nr:hypothetical protein [Altererythrobacter sp. CAU 1644]WFL76906.1 hypothetical protein P7228_13025 [Altererythrobacter sp. CAU 1644]
MAGALRTLGLALACLLAACTENPEVVSPLEKARQELAAGNGLGAETVLLDALEGEAASRLDLAAYLGEADLLQGDLKGARQWLGPGEFAEASRAHGYHMLGRLELAEGNLAAAGAAFDRAYLVGGASSELWVDVGRLRYRGGEQLQAIEAADKALAHDRRNPAALNFKGQLVRDAHGFAAALPWFAAGLEMAPEDRALLAEQAASLGDAGAGKDMLRSIRHFARVAPDDRRSDNLQAVLAVRGGKYDVARTLLLRSGELQREAPSAMLLSAIIDLESGNFASAAQTLERLADLQPQNRLAQLLFARALSLGGSDKELIYRFEDLARRPSASPYLVLLVARSHEALGQRDKAAWYLDRASKARDGRLLALQAAALTMTDESTAQEGDAAFSTVRTLVVSGQAAEAVRRAENLVERHSGSADVLNLAGDAHLAAGNADRALERYAKAAQIRRDWSLAKRMAAAHKARGNREAAEQMVAAQLRGEPSNGEAAAMLAVMRATKSDWKRAALLIDHAFAHGAARDVNLLALRSEAAANLGNDAEARRYSAEAHSISPMNARATQIYASSLAHDASRPAAAKALEEKARKLQARARR